MCHALHVPPSAVYDGLVRARVPGRMETYANADGSLHAIVDYAHNRLSFETLFRSVRAEYPGREMAVVFGCREKAYDRRRDLGEASRPLVRSRSISPGRTAGEDTLDICRGDRPNVEGGLSRPDHPQPGRGHPPGGAGLRRTPVLLLTGKGRETRQAWDRLYHDTYRCGYAGAFLRVRPAPGAGTGGPARALLSILLPWRHGGRNSG